MNINETIEKVIEDINLSGFAKKINLNSCETAKVLGISLSGLEGMRRRAEGPSYVSIGKRIFYTKRAIASYIVLSQVKTL